MLLCFEYRQHPDTGLAITYPTAHGNWLFGGHILAAFRYKMILSMVGKNKKKDPMIWFLFSICLQDGASSKHMAACALPLTGLLLGPRTIPFPPPRCCTRPPQNGRRICWVRSGRVANHLRWDHLHRTFQLWVSSGRAAARQRDVALQINFWMQNNCGSSCRGDIAYNYFNKECMQKEFYRSTTLWV